MNQPANLEQYLQDAKNGPQPGETEQQFTQRIVAAAIAIQGRLESGERSTIAEPQTFDEISTPGTTQHVPVVDDARRAEFQRLRAEIEQMRRDRNRRIVIAAIAGIALAAPIIATGGIPSLGAIAGFATKALSAIFADGDGVDADVPDVDPEPAA